jgi:hypothetical protein
MSVWSNLFISLQMMVLQLEGRESPMLMGAWLVAAIGGNTQRIMNQF